jgi:ribonuclease Z
MKPGVVVLPREIERPVDALLRCWRDVERQGTPYQLMPMIPGQLWEVRRDFGIRAFATHHGGPSLGYALISIREKLKPEYVGKTGPELAEMKKHGVEIQYRVEVPTVAFLGDTTIGPVFDQPDVQNAQVLITEVTFFEPAHRAKAKVGKHLHIDHFIDLLPKLNNEHIVLSHVSRRTGVRKARRLLARRIGEEQMNRIHFLMDFEGARDEGEIEEQAPPPPDTAE